MSEFEDLNKSFRELRKLEEFQQQEAERAKLCKLVPPNSGTAKDLGCDKVNRVNEIPFEKL